MVTLLQSDVSELQAAVGAEASTRSGTITLNWPGGDFVRLREVGNEIHVEYLLSAQREGRLTTLAATLPGFFRARGFEAITANGSANSKALLRVGFVATRGHLVCDIAEGSRVDEYASWKRGAAAEPPWHSALAAVDG